MRKLTPAFAALAASMFLAAPAAAQQFTFAGSLPGGAVWSEGLEGSDVDNDGDIDVFVANGEGFSGPGPKRQNTLLINQFIEIGPGQMTDESIARLGVRLTNGKQVITGDVQNDGWEDALFINAFNTGDIPGLYINQGSSNPGFYTFDSVARGFTFQQSASDAAFGDPDNDGDLDVVMVDAGNNLVGSGSNTGAPSKLFLNDGDGFFTVDPNFNPGNDNGPMDAHFVDIDQDFDADIWINNHFEPHKLLLNDGNGNFTDATGLIPATTDSVYEADVSDLDNDGDIDMYFISLTASGGGPFGGFPGEGPLENNFAGSGALSFTKGGILGAEDDNEVAFCDYDMDGDLDAFIGSLTGPSEKVHRNDGNMVFTDVSTVVQSIGDSTLDCTFLDIDNDGDYDFLTSQGESNSAQWNNKVYLNSGPADTLAPVIVREELVDFAYGQPAVVRVEIRDQVMDDGKNWVSGVANVVLNDGTKNVGATLVEGTKAGSGLYRFELANTVDCAVTSIDYSITFTDWAGNASSTPLRSVSLAGACQYGLDFSPSPNSVSLSGGGDIGLGGTFELTASDLPSPTAPVFAVIALGELSFPFLGGQALFNPATTLDPVLFVAAAGGEATFSIGLPTEAALAGANAYFQAAADAGGGAFALSNGVRLTIAD